MALRSLSLCSGVGMLDIGVGLAESDHRTVCYVEWDHFAASVLVARMEDETLPAAPVWDDVGTFDGRPWRGVVDLVTTGFPCQPVSLAGKRLGMADERFIWGDIARIIGEVRPRYIFLENVPGILTADGGAFLSRVFGDLVELGFDCEWDFFSAEETGAPHRRQRWFCLGRNLANAAIGGGELRRGGLRSEPRVRDGDRQPASIEQGGDSGLRDGLGLHRSHVANPRHGLVQEPGRGPQGRDGAGPAGAVLGHADRAGRQEHGGTEPVRTQQPPAERAVGDVGDAASGARRRPAPGHGGHAAQPGQEPVANAAGSGQRAQERDDDARQPDAIGCVSSLALAECQQRDGSRQSRHGRGQPANGCVYPPARNDHAGWADLIAADPSLEPAVRGDADGLATGLDPSTYAFRNQRLRAVGNGVVPLTAALAWTELKRRMEGDR